MSSHATRALPRGALSTNRYVTPKGGLKAARTRREYRDVLHNGGGFAAPRLKSRRKHAAR
jgi:hypothetical protein